ncbi:uncharacterized protein LOC110038410 [Phalaenopsis equestris]|uniref:uncharacterized protein LOC110038410 n=1 Tax=Phalaenopsis equestris TaxID=78828 RepID=UPI0009E47ABF|nr:uncharacterized protein LOC110038410 [Phalaenopsis equestris]
MLETREDNKPLTAGSNTVEDAGETPSMSKSAMKRLLKQQRLQARKAERKAAEKERRRQDLERRRREWEEKLTNKTEEERMRLVESRKETRRDRMEKRTEERSKRAERLRKAALVGQKVVLDLEFSDLMSPSEIQSLSHQVMYPSFFFPCPDILFSRNDAARGIFYRRSVLPCRVFSRITPLPSRKSKATRIRRSALPCRIFSRITLAPLGFGISSSFVRDRARKPALCFVRDRTVALSFLLSDSLF